VWWHRLHAHLQAQCFGPLLFTVEWFSTLFSISTHRTVALCAFDLFLCQVLPFFPPSSF
jgi:hypothetical protein